MPQNSSAPPSTSNRHWGFSTAGRVFFGWGVSEELRAISKELGKRAMICTDKNIVQSGIAERVEGLLKEGGAEVLVFPEGKPEVDLATIGASAKVAAEFRPDVIIGVGGGSNMDLGKCTAILHKYGGALSQYYGEHNVPGPLMDIVCIPTTSGTGSEVSPVAVVADPDRFMKVGIATRRIIPKWALVDPSLTVSCPPRVTSHSGMDALSHAIESFCAKVPEGRSPHAIFVGKNPASDSLARQAIELIARSLPTAVNDPTNRQGREDMALASLLAGMAFSAAGTATVHALQYPVGEATHTSHGLGNAVLMPSVMRAIVKSRIPEMAFIARAFNPGLKTVSDEEAAEQAPELVAQLGDKVMIPRGLGAIGMKREQIDEMAELATSVKRLLDNSPVAFDKQALIGILEAAF
ncbi:MAG TPA: iron-containing alcohol dehydrogenase [Terriglobia bacterium]|nr:iron-containing alcohol dehydrogenase [Terriglobia bacterium]